MIGEILAQIVGEAAFGRLGRSERAQVIVRVFFGLLGTFLGTAGAAVFLRPERPVTNPAMHASVVSLFVCLALFSLCNVAMKRTWRWPGLGIVASFAALVLFRLLLGP